MPLHGGFKRLVLVLALLGVELFYPVEVSAERRFIRQQRRQIRIQNRQFNRNFVLMNRGRRLVRNNVRIVQNNVNNSNRGIDLGNQQRIPGFSRIRTAGNALVGVDRFGRAEVVSISSGDLRDRFGNNLAQTDPVLHRQFVEFYFQNLDNFAGNARAEVLRFLARNAPNSGFFGTLTAQILDRQGLSAGVTPSGAKYKNFPKEQIRTAALSWTLNMLSNSCTPIRIPPGGSAADGTFTQNLNGFIENARLATLLNENPYSCGDNRAPARVDWLVSRAMTPEVYYSVQGLSNNIDGLSRQLGVQSDQQNEFDLTGRRIDRIAVVGPREGADKESAVGVNPQRVLEVQNRANSVGSSFYRSYDFIEHPTSGSNAESRDVLSQGINFTADASEIIFTKCNNFMGFYLADGKGNRARAAPAEIAIDAGKSVVSPDRCMKCHANGFHGGDRRNFGKGEPYQDHFAAISALDGPNQSFHSRFFSRNGEYKARKVADSARFASAKAITGSHLQDPDESETSSLPVVFDMAEEYRKPLTLAQAAAELGVAPSPDLAVALVMNPDGKTIDRENFERKYCLLRANLGAASSGAVGTASSLRGQGGASGVGGVSHGGSPAGSQGTIIRREAPTN